MTPSSPDPLALHRGLLTLDTHIDIPWPTGPDPFLDGTRRVDLPKMQRGGLAAGCFAAYVPQAARTAESEAAAFERAIGMLHAIRAMGRSENGISARVAVTADEIAAAKRDGVLAIVPAVENGFAIGADLARLARFRALGARYLTMTHNGHNALADSCNPRKDLGDALDRARRPQPARARRDRRTEPARHAGGCRPRLARQHAAGSGTVVHAGGVNAFLYSRAVRQFAQHGRCAARRAARRAAA